MSEGASGKMRLDSSRDQNGSGLLPEEEVKAWKVSWSLSVQLWIRHLCSLCHVDCMPRKVGEEVEEDAKEQR